MTAGLAAQRGRPIVDRMHARAERCSDPRPKKIAEERLGRCEASNA